MEKIKNYQDQILTKINLNYEKKEENEKFKLKQKGANQWAYEHVS